ncbi:hypothetical protein K2F54_11365 [Cryobacterium sp. 1639]|uniref:HdeD family acid-resistance protein n=1 Tax=Cryobacterium inferilacus TaxID=2866629 RepID=UPI001C72F848|nr:DUF308 domain-containing protein [Cryobacterium sp. 1639]MBX0300575.1 hypothetical protein [Cryobacterium sp. 1639]
MAHAPAAAVIGTRYWTLPVARAIVAFVPAAVITFNADHSAQFGLLVFGAFALVNGLVTVLLSWRTVTDLKDRRIFVIQGAVGVVAGVLALAVTAGGLGFFLYIVSVWAAVTGVLELYTGIRVRGRGQVARDWLIVGALTAVLALVFLLLPPHAVVAVGLLGAYLVIIGVYLVIAGVSLTTPSADAPRDLASSSTDSDTP